MTASLRTGPVKSTDDLRTDEVAQHSPSRLVGRVRSPALEGPGEFLLCRGQGPGPGPPSLAESIVIARHREYGLCAAHKGRGRVCRAAMVSGSRIPKFREYKYAIRWLHELAGPISGVPTGSATLPKENGTLGTYAQAGTTNPYLAHYI